MHGKICYSLTGGRNHYTVLGLGKVRSMTLSNSEDDSHIGGLWACDYGFKLLLNPKEG